jgi:hypothetical protein
MVWWHVGEIGARHGFSAATMGACCTDVYGRREQDDAENSHHDYLSFPLTVRGQKGTRGSDMEVQMDDLTPAANPVSVR